MLPRPKRRFLGSSKPKAKTSPEAAGGVTRARKSRTLSGGRTFGFRSLQNSATRWQKSSSRTEETVYDLVIIGTERKGAQGFFLPSTKAYAITEAIVPPVLVVPASRPDIKRILICSGGGAYIDNAVRFTSKIAKDLSAQVTLLNVTPLPAAMHGTILRRQEDAAALLNSNSALARNLRTEKGIIETAGVSAVVRIRHGIVIQEILAEIEESDHDLVVVGSWPVRDALRNYAIGNVMREIVNRTDRPVLVIRSDIEPASLKQRLRNMVKKLGGKQDAKGWEKADQSKKLGA